MAKGENIFKRKDGRWEARYVRGRELSGKIKYGFCYGKTYREAKEKVTSLQHTTQGNVSLFIVMNGFARKRTLCVNLHTLNMKRY